MGTPEYLAGMPRKVASLLRAACIAALVTYQLPAFALPTIGFSAIAKSARRPVHQPVQTVAVAFETLLGRELDGREQRQLETAVQDIDDFNLRPQNVSWVSDVWDRYEILPMICLVGKAGVRIPALGKLQLGGVAWNFEKTPCLVLNSINPFSWDASLFRSYVMTGTSFAQANGNYGGVSGGIMMGIYAGPKTLSKPLIGTYGFARFSIDRGVGKVLLQAAYSNNQQLLVMAGVGADISFEAIWNAVKILPKIEPGAIAAAGIKAELGAYFDVKEFPWFSRLLSGVDPITTFRDVDQYIAQQK